MRNRRNLSSPSDAQDEFFKSNPVDLGIYVQDKMEFGGLIANVGLRLDLYNQNIDYYTNQFNPFLNPNYDPTQPPVGENVYLSPDLADEKPTHGFTGCSRVWASRSPSLCRPCSI